MGDNTWAVVLMVALAAVPTDPPISHSCGKGKGRRGAMGETRTVTPSDRLTPGDPASRGTEVGPVPGRPAPPPVDLALLWVAVVAVSTSGPLIRAADAPSLAIAFYRNALALPVVFAAVLLVRGRRRELRSLGPRERRRAALAGLFLAHQPVPDLVGHLVLGREGVAGARLHVGPGAQFVVQPGDRMVVIGGNGDFPAFHDHVTG